MRPARLIVSLGPDPAHSPGRPPGPVEGPLVGESDAVGDFAPVLASAVRGETTIILSEGFTGPEPGVELAALVPIAEFDRLRRLADLVPIEPSDEDRAEYIEYLEHISLGEVS